MQTTLIVGNKQFKPKDYEIRGELTSIVSPVIETLKLSEDMLHRSGLCVIKAVEISNAIPDSKIVFGSIFVVSITGTSSFGYAYHPTYGEFHAWVEYQGQIIDWSLPEVINMGMTSQDDQGYLIEGREPFILAGWPPDWVLYRKEDTLEQFNSKMGM